MNSGPRPVVLFGALLLLTLVVFVPGLTGDFILDDYHLIQGRSDLMRSGAGLAQLVSHGFWWGAPAAVEKRDLYRPVVSASYWLDWHTGSGKPWAFHVTNWMLHAANAILTAVLLSMLTGPVPAVVVAALAAISPVAVTSVGWISGRTDLWAVFFILAFLITFLKWRAGGITWYRIAAYSSFFLALASKETAVAAPLLAGMLDWVTATPKAKKTSRRSAGLDYALLLLPLGLYLVLRTQALGVVSAGGLGVNGVLRAVPSFSEQVLRSAARAIAPLQYTIGALDVRQLWGQSGASGAGFIALWVAFLIALTALGTGLKRRKPWAAGGLWFILILAPVYLTGGACAPILDFYSYPGLAGLWLLIVAAESELFARFGNGLSAWQRIRIPAAVLLIVVYAALTMLRLPILRNEKSLWTNELARQPQSTLALMALSELSFRDGDARTGVDYARRAEQSDRNAWMPHVILAQYYLDKGDPQSAARNVDALAKIGGGAVLAQATIGRFYYETGHCADASAAYERALKLKSPPPETFYSYGLALLCENRSSEAAQAYRTWLKMRPESVEGWSNLGICHENLGEYEQALQAYREAVRLNPAFAVGWESLATVYIQQNKLTEAEAALARYTALRPPAERIQRLRDSLARAREAR